MRRQRVRLFAAALLVPVVLMFEAGVAGATVITSLVSLADAAKAVGWAAHPDQTAGGTEQFVTGPLTPPAGIGSLQMTAATNTDRALVFIVPKPGIGVTPPGDVGPMIATPWSDLSGSFSTFTANTAQPASSIPVMKIVGYQVWNANNPLLSTGFTTLNFEGSNNGTVSANQWQKWTLGPTSVVWQSNQGDGFCPITAPCTLAAFAAHYDTGAWGQLQVGLGAGVPAGATGNVDDVQVSDGTTNFVYDFDVTPLPTTTTTTTVATTPTTSPPVAATGTPTPVASTASGSQLPRTGTHSNETLAVALVGIGLGTVLTVVAKRRRPTG